MKTQDYLRQISRFEFMIQRKRAEAKRLEILACGTPGNGMNPDKVQTSMRGDAMSSAVAKIVDLERETDRLVELYIDKRTHIISQIDAMPNMKSYVYLNDIYVEHKTIGEIAFDLGCSQINVKQGHAKALKEFEELYGQEYLDNPTMFV